MPTTSKLLQPGQEVPKSSTAKWSSVKRSRNTPSTKKRVKIILIGTPNSVIELLQKIQNFAARLVLLAPRHQHSTPLLEKLHWLPISERIKYKLACMCFNVCVSVCGSGLAYLSELLHVYTPSRTLRSCHTRMLKIQQYKRKKTHGFRTLSCFGSHI